MASPRFTANFGGCIQTDGRHASPRTRMNTWETSPPFKKQLRKELATQNRLIPGCAACPDMLRVILPHYECERHNTDIECIRHLRKLRLVREVGLEEVLGLGNTSDFRSGRVRSVRDLPLPGRTRRPRPRFEYHDVYRSRRRSSRQGRVDVGVGGGR
jgi:hypothetical protein